MSNLTSCVIGVSADPHFLYVLKLHVLFSRKTKVYHQCKKEEDGARSML